MTLPAATAPSPAFWRDRRVLLTGHTGFKGAWAALWLRQMGARVTGLALDPEDRRGIFATACGGIGIADRRGDILDPAAVADAVAAADPEVVIHMAAQTLVRRSYAEPVETMAVNALGTARVLDALRPVDGLRAVVVVTTDKVYANAGDGRPFVEGDRLGGHDPYSASKAAAEHVAACWADSFLRPRGVACATVRAGNVLGGGDWAEDRLVPDFFRSQRSGEPLRVRYPKAVRPWQFVLEPLAGYLMYAERLAAGKGADGLPRILNFGPDATHCRPVAEVLDVLCRRFPGVRVERDEGPKPHEASLLTLDSSLARRVLGWAPRLGLAETLAVTADWYEAQAGGTDMAAFSRDQIAAFAAVEAA